MAARARRIAVVVLVLLLAVPPMATVLPGSPASVHVGGITLLWWYAACVGPLVAVVVTLLSRAIRPERRLTAGRRRA